MRNRQPADTRWVTIVAMLAALAVITILSIRLDAKDDEIWSLRGQLTRSVTVHVQTERPPPLFVDGL